MPLPSRPVKDKETLLAGALSSDSDYPERKVLSDGDFRMICWKQRLAFGPSIFLDSKLRRIW